MKWRRTRDSIAAFRGPTIAASTTDVSSTSFGSVSSKLSIAGLFRKSEGSAFETIVQTQGWTYRDSKGSTKKPSNSGTNMSPISETTNICACSRPACEDVDDEVSKPVAGEILMTTHLEVVKLNTLIESDNRNFRSFWQSTWNDLCSLSLSSLDLLPIEQLFQSSDRFLYNTTSHTRPTNVDRKDVV